MNIETLNLFKRYWDMVAAYWVCYLEFICVMLSLCLNSSVLILACRKVKGMSRRTERYQLQTCLFFGVMHFDVPNLILGLFHVLFFFCYGLKLRFSVYLGRYVVSLMSLLSTRHPNPKVLHDPDTLSKLARPLIAL